MHGLNKWLKCHVRFPGLSDYCSLWLKSEVETCKQQEIGGDKDIWAKLLAKLAVTGRFSYYNKRFAPSVYLFYIFFLTRPAMFEC